MGKRYILDSNAIIDYVGDRLPHTSALALDKIIDDELNTSIVIKIEVLGFDGEPIEMQKLKDFLGLANISYIDDSVADKAIELQKIHRKLELGDALIASTALLQGFIIITRNTKDFDNISGLDCINPYEM